MMQMYGTIFLYIIAMMFVASLFICDQPEKFWHDVNKEFDADNQYAAKLKDIVVGVQKLNEDNVVDKDPKKEEPKKETELAAKPEE